MKTEQLSDILSLSRTCFRVNVSSKKKCLELIAQTVANEFPQIKSTQIFDAMVARERLGSTSIGHGCAIPHCRVSNTDHIVGALILLNEPIDFDSPDKKPVDIIFAVVVPEDDDEEHLQILSMIAEKLSDPYLRERLRHSNEQEMLFQQVIGS